MVSWFIILSAATTERSAKVMDRITISNIIVTVMLNDLCDTADRNITQHTWNIKVEGLCNPLAAATGANGDHRASTGWLAADEYQH